MQKMKDLIQHARQSVKPVATSNVVSNQKRSTQTMATPAKETTEQMVARFKAKAAAKKIPATQGAGAEFTAPASEVTGVPPPVVVSPASNPQVVAPQQIKRPVGRPPSKQPVTQAAKPQQSNGQDQQPTVGEQLQAVGLSGIQAEATEAEPKTFPAMLYTMGTLACQLVIMTMEDVFNYLGYATDLYDVTSDVEADTEKDHDKALKQFITNRPDQTFQRAINKDRPGQIASYLTSGTHFLPPLITVPNSEAYELTDGSVTVAAHALACLDGQHRKAGIDKLFRSSGPDSPFAKEQIPVVILSPDITLDTRQQIFSDINRTPKTVSKALNILFDHRDPYAMITKAVADQVVGIDGKTLIDLVRTSPAATSNHIAALSNIYSLVVNFAASKEGKAGSHLREGTTSDLAVQVALAVAYNMPSFDRMAANQDSFKAVSVMYVVYKSTFWQAIGSALRRTFEVRTKDILPEMWSDVAGTFMQETDWTFSNPIWSESESPLDPTLKYSPVVSGSKVGTRRENVDRAVTILVKLWADIDLTAITQANK